MAFPDTDMPIEIEAAFGADPSADPGTWSFTDLSSRLTNTPITKSAGRSSGANEGEPGQVSFTLDNSDGALTPLNPLSTYFPNVVLGVPVRITINPTGTPTEWFAGYAASWAADFIPSTDGEPLAVVRVTASGILRRLQQGTGPLRSALYRTMAGISPDDYSPFAYWPLEDGPDATQAASGLPNGAPMLTGGTVTFGNAEGPVGSDTLVTLAAGATLTAKIPSYTDTGQWATQMFVNVPSEPGSEQVYAEFRSTGTARRITFSVIPGSPSQHGVRVYDATGGSLGNYFRNLDGTNSQTPSEANFFGRWLMYAIGLNDDFGSPEVFFGGTTDATISQYGGAAAGASLGRITQVKLFGGTTGASFGHLGVWVDPAYSFLTDAVTTAAAIDGHAGEQAHERAERLCREEGVPLTITGSNSAPMGPQIIGTLLENLQECETADVGLLGEDGFGLHFICLEERYNRPVDLTVDLATYRTASGTGRQVLQPVLDDQRYRNRWVVDRANGSQAIADLSNGGLVYEDSTTANVATDAQVADQASWRVYRDSIVANRYANAPIDLGANTALIDDWLAVVPGLGRIVRTGLPATHFADDVDEMVDGTSETLERRRWTAQYNGSPAAAYTVGVWDDDTLGKWDTAGSELHTAVNSSATSWDVATTVGPLWTTDNTEDGWDWWVGGERVTVTDVAASTITYGAVGTVSHGNNASVTPGLPASLAQGNLMVMVAAIRNSGSGVPNTPAGWTRWPTFQSTDNVQVFAKIAGASESGPTVTFTGGVANADTTAQIIRLAGKWHSADFALLSKASCLNASAQDITYPGLPKPQADNCLILYVGWKQDDWTSVASPGTEIAEPDTTTGDDQGIVWAYQIQTSRTSIPSGVFTVTGGAGAISRGAVMAIRCDYQTATVTRSVNGVSKSHAAGAEVRLWTPMRWAL